MTVRRVVTGVGPDGKSRVASDSPVAPLTAQALPGYSWHRLWSIDGACTVPNDGAPAPLAEHFPPTHGVRFDIFTVPPAGAKPEPGQIWLELDDGHEVHLQAGDTIVQNGVRHAWRNHSDRPCTMVIFLVGAARQN